MWKLHHHAGLSTVGFVLYHGMPVDIGVTNPYWGPDAEVADAIQWATVLAAIAVGAWAARLVRSRSTAHERTLGQRNPERLAR